MNVVELAAARIAPYARRTPVMRTEIDGRPLVLKLENLQRTGSFKFRGAVNALLAGGKPDRVVTASGGNHGAAVAAAAAVLGVPATVYAPESIPDGKARRIVAAGAELVRVGETYAEAAKLRRNSRGCICLRMTTRMWWPGKRLSPRRLWLTRLMLILLWSRLAVVGSPRGPC